MVKKKLAHFAENLTFSHLFQYTQLDLLQEFPLKGKWHSGFFMNENPVTLELGCGKGEYTINLAMLHPERNFIGVDIKGARLWKGCKMTQELGLKNVAFIRTRIEHITYFFSQNEVDEIWLTFPDPQPQSNRINRRLTSPVFLERYRQFLTPGAVIHLKTDNTMLYRYTLLVIRENSHTLVYASDNIYNEAVNHEATSIQTFYESMFRKEGVPIKYLEFSLKDEH
ncbi:MAG: tRNA (guanosine(46)-N7)-methyltransferase TrmB [Bacteroidales bacterium]|nr:tRNA (guanosine(46)-N7)-methyltransferase TrmB [Bacteroidales bacterium]